MKNNISVLLVSAFVALLSVPSFAQQFEVVHAINFNNSMQAKSALDTLMTEPDLKDGHVTLYAQTFGEHGSSHLIVEDFDSYADYEDLTAKRLASHGWSRYLLQTTDSDYLGSSMVMVLDDHGKPRRTAGYLVAYLIKTSDPATYRSAMAELGDAIGNPGVLRLGGMRTGGMAYNQVVLIGGADFKAVNEYLDKLFASDAFAEFQKKVGDIREVVGVNMYHRVAVWGD